MRGAGGRYGFAGGTGPRQIYYDEAKTLVNVVGRADGASYASRFRVDTPDSRLRVKVSLLFVRRATTGTVADLGATLYMAEEELDDSGLSGQYVRCNDILRDSTGALVHASAPLAIPEDPALSGWSQEFVTAADALFGEFTTGQGTGTDAGASGVWVAQARFQPDGQRLHDLDWSEVIRMCRLSVLAPEGSLT